MQTMLVTIAQMQKIERQAVAQYSIPVLLLMESAGLACVEEIIKRRASRKSPILIFCGPGNNGGDGFVIARHLFCRGFKVQVFHFAPAKHASQETTANYEMVRRLKIPYQKNPSQITLQKALARSEWAVDALFGIGLSRHVSEKVCRAIELINASKVKVLSADIPSGLHADTGAVLGAAVKANLTVTFGLAKKAFASPAAEIYTGQVIVKPLCFPPQLLGR